MRIAAFCPGAWATNVSRCPAVVILRLVRKKPAALLDELQKEDNVINVEIEHQPGLAEMRNSVGP
jgi:hypothetical protein